MPLQARDFFLYLPSVMILAHATTANEFAELPVEALTHTCVRQNIFAVNEFAPPPPIA
jgi:hypothetical protein